MTANKLGQIMPFMGKKDPDLMPAEQRDEMVDDADIDGPLLDYAQKGTKVEFLGKDKLEGTDVYKLKVTSEEMARSRPITSTPTRTWRSAVDT